MLDWARSDPEGLLAAARYLASARPLAENEKALRMFTLVTADRSRDGRAMREEFLNQLLAARAEGLVEAARILIGHREEVIAVMSRFGYTDPKRIGGFLDRDLTQSEHDSIK